MHMTRVKERIEDSQRKRKGGQEKRGEWECAHHFQRLSDQGSDFVLVFLPLCVSELTQVLLEFGTDFPQGSGGSLGQVLKLSELSQREGFQRLEECALKTRGESWLTKRAK